MQLDIREARADELETLFPLLLLAEPSASALRWGLKNLSDTVYRIDAGGELAGAATMRWRRDPCEMASRASRQRRRWSPLVALCK